MKKLVLILSLAMAACNPPSGSSPDGHPENKSDPGMQGYSCDHLKKAALLLNGYAVDVVALELVAKIVEHKAPTPAIAAACLDQNLNIQCSRLECAIEEKQK